uniref:Cap binding protein n=1 Tax=Rhizophora mucronata TaxID=61149 RepID=A0A2P2L934_RHIMU
MLICFQFKYFPLKMCCLTNNKMLCLCVYMFDIYISCVHSKLLRRLRELWLA